MGFESSYTGFIDMSGKWKIACHAVIATAVIANSWCQYLTTGVSVSEGDVVIIMYGNIYLIFCYPVWLVLQRE